MFYNCETCIDVKFDSGEKKVSSIEIRNATKNGFVPLKFRNMASMIKNPNVTGEDIWLRTLKQKGYIDWTVCSLCYREISTHLNMEMNLVEEPQYDTFISYAAEDTEFANRLAGGLVVRGLKIWYAPLSLKMGDKLLTGIEEGLRKSRSGTIVLSKKFLEKSWTNYELDILMRQTIEKDKLLLQIWHNITKEQIEERYLGLTGILSIDSSDGLRKTIESIATSLASSATLRGTTPVWESPKYRFLSGKGEIQLQKIGGATISLFELLVNFERKDFPLALDGELFSRRDLARYAKKVMDKDINIVRNWTDQIDRLAEVLREEGIEIE